MQVLLQENVYVAILNLMEAKGAVTLLDPCSEMRLGWEQMRIPKAGNKVGNYLQVKRKKKPQTQLKIPLHKHHRW